MKCKFVNAITVLLITLAVLSPGLLVFSVVWEQHMCFQNIDNLGSTTHHISAGKLAFSHPKKVILWAQDKPHDKFFSSNLVEELLTFTENYKIVKILQWFFLCFPMFLGIITLVYDRYLMYRAAVYQQKVKMLERLWQQNIEQ